MAAVIIALHRITGEAVVIARMAPEDADPASLPYVPEEMIRNFVADHAKAAHVNVADLQVKIWNNLTAAQSRFIYDGIPGKRFKAAQINAAVEEMQKTALPGTQIESARVAEEFVSVELHGSLCLVRPRSEAVRTWLKEHTDSEAQWFGGALVVEPRYLMPFLKQLSDDLQPRSEA